MIEFLWNCDVSRAAWFFTAVNLVIFCGSISLCWVLGVVFRTRRLFASWETLRLTEVAAAILALFLNVVVSIAGWWLWKRGIIVLGGSGIIRACFDVLLMTLVMDFGMYVFHRVAHVRWIYQWIHSFHHRHESTNPISLFVLHPLEVLGFGGLMIGVLCLLPITPAGLVGYLTLNVLFGTLGHSGVEPFPPCFRRIPLLKYLGTSTFHGGHHQRQAYNFGFYTLFWDKLFGTLDPEYDVRFQGGKNHWP